MPSGGGGGSTTLRTGCPEVHEWRWLWRRDSLGSLLHSRQLQLPMSFELLCCRSSFVGRSEVGCPRRGPGWSEPQFAAKRIGVLMLRCSLSILASPLICKVVRDPPSSEPAELSPAHPPLPGAITMTFADTIAKISATA